MTRARYNVILECISRILCHLEDRDKDEVLAELRQMLENEMAAQAEELKEYMKRARS